VLATPGVLKTGVTRVTLLKVLPLRQRKVIKLALVVGRNQKLIVHCVLVGNGSMSWRNAPVTGPPTPLACTNREWAPLC
jgi:hypothetical protein